PGIWTSTLIADALDWYVHWNTLSSRAAGTQTCRGEHRGTNYTFRCDPLAVVVQIMVTAAGDCAILAMSPSRSSADGLQANSFHNTSVQPHGCGELRLRDGPFALTIAPHARKMNNAVTKSARDAALAYNKRGGDR